jgi:quercetin dioxygenase-like cupin family protein
MKKKQNEFVENIEINWKELGGGVKRKIMAFDDKLMLVRVAFKKGSVGSIHKHPHSQITNIESGRFEIIINDEKKVLNAGDAFYIPPNTDHGCVCIEDGVLIDVFSPMREDFLNGNGKKK